MRPSEAHAELAAERPLQAQATCIASRGHNPMGPAPMTCMPSHPERVREHMRGTENAPSALKLASKDRGGETEISARSGVLRGKDWLKRWFLEDALPLWQRHGLDLHNGGFFEKLTGDLQPVEEPRRARLVARQIYVYAIADEMGWVGPSAEIVAHGLDFITRRMLCDDGTVIASLRVDGTDIRDTYDPYDYAFVLFGLAAAAKCLGAHTLAARAAKIRDRMIEQWAHPVAGFQECAPPKIPLKANSHMHLLEAFLAWEELNLPDAGIWRTLADGIVGLCLSYLIDPLTGAIEEFYDLDWRSLTGEAGGLIEPGHQFEWAWLLLRWANRRQRTDVMAQVFRLVQIGEDHGVDETRGVAINALGDDFSVRDASAKLWPQTERIKAWCALASCARNPTE